MTKISYLNISATRTSQITDFHTIGRSLNSILIHRLIFKHLSRVSEAQTLPCRRAAFGLRQPLPLTSQ